ncbi:hypothetical protein [Shewanella donghaensis]|uniref:hypothetical protein n=1 Tax=Shewanella donghaensis TaxID=238836 RepID=UPI0011820EC0|nr:hypothetical protein [Shewanella donghaensis]
MSNIIQLLERMGQDADLQNPQLLADAISTSSLTPELKQALLNNDTSSLEKQLDICPDVVGLMVLTEDDQPEDEGQPSEKVDSGVADLRMTA